MFVFAIGFTSFVHRGRAIGHNGLAFAIAVAKAI